MTFKSFKGHIYVRVQPILSGNQPRASLCFLRDPVNDALHGLSIKAMSMNIWAQFTFL